VLPAPSVRVRERDLDAIGEPPTVFECVLDIGTGERTRSPSACSVASLRPRWYPARCREHYSDKRGGSVKAFVETQRGERALKGFEANIHLISSTRSYS
jgi:hypothetical protein